MDQTRALDRVVEMHEVMGLGLAVLFAGLAAWRIWRRNAFGAEEQQSYIVAALAGALVLLWAAHLGGTMVYRFGAGVETRVEQR